MYMYIQKTHYILFLPLFSIYIYTFSIQECMINNKSLHFQVKIAVFAYETCVKYDLTFLLTSSFVDNLN